MTTRFLSVLMACVMLFAAAVPAAFAETSGNDGDLKVTHHSNEDGSHTVKAEVVGADSVEGTYTFSGVGEDQTSATGEVVYKDLEPGTYTVQVTFEGTVAGVDKILSGKLSFEVEEADSGENGDPSGTEGDAKAPEMKDPAEKDTEQGKKREDQKASEKKQDAATPVLDVWHFIWDESTVEIGGAVVGKAKGTWTISLDGEAAEEVYVDYDQEFNETYAWAFFQAEEGSHQLHVKFEGTVNGKRVTLEDGYSFEFKAPAYGFEMTFDGKRTIGGKITDAKNAKGYWGIAVWADEFSEEPIALHESDERSGLKYAHTFKDLKPGTYYAAVWFGGEIDGEETFVFDEAEITVKDDGSITPPDDKKPPKITDPDKGKQIVDDIKQGGKLPKTATDHPTWVFFGGLLLIVGLALLKFRTAKG